MARRETYIGECKDAFGRRVKIGDQVVFLHDGIAGFVKEIAITETDNKILDKLPLIRVKNIRTGHKHSGRGDSAIILLEPLLFPEPPGSSQMNKAFSHCHACGTGYHAMDVDQGAWPRRCPACRVDIYGGPSVVIAALVPYRDGLMKILRKDGPPGWALCSGFIDRNETWQRALVRELEEETGLLIPERDVRLVSVKHSMAKNLHIIFGWTPQVPRNAFDTFSPNREVLEIGVHTLTTPELVFPTHNEVARKYLTSVNSNLL